MLRFVGSEPVEDKRNGRSMLDEIARESARRMLLVALEAAQNCPVGVGAF